MYPIVVFFQQIIKMGRNNRNWNAQKYLQGRHHYEKINIDADVKSLSKSQKKNKKRHQKRNPPERSNERIWMVSFQILYDTVLIMGFRK